MRRIERLSFFFALVALAAIGGYTLASSAPGIAGEPRVTPPGAERAPAEMDVCTEAAPALPAAGAEADPTNATCGPCPYGAPQCHRDGDCDAYCGVPGWGACYQANSCYRCCSCLG